MANGYPMMNYGRPYPKTPEQLQNEMQASIDRWSPTSLHNPSADCGGGFCVYY